MPRPTSTHEQRESVRALALVVGVREAARRLNLDQNRVMKWSERYNWLIPQPNVSLSTKGERLQTVSKTADVLQNIIAEQGRITKHALSGAALKASERFEEMPADKVIEKSGRLLDITKVASTIHGWQEATASSALNLNVLSGGRAIVQVNEKPGPNENSE